MDHQKQTSEQGVLGTFYYQTADVLWDGLYNSAYEKFKGKIAEEAQLGATALEWKKSLGMIEARALQLYDFTRNLKKLRFADAFSYLTVDPNAGLPKRYKNERALNTKNVGLARDANILFDDRFHGRKDLKAYGGARLEYSFGWKPLMQDIYNACRILDRPIRPKTVRGRAREGHEWGSSVDAGFGYRFLYTSSGIARVQHIADIRMVNPNLAMANHLGLVNPFSVAWELFPWSFVVDWFANVGQMLGTLSDFVGMAIENPATTKGYNSHGTFKYTYNNVLYYTDTFRQIRETVLPIPTFQFDPLPGFSPGRAANAISLLVQRLGR